MRARTVTTVLSLVAGLYLVVVLAGCLGYRAVLYPAPRDARPTPPPGAALRALPSAEGEVLAVHFPAPPGAPTVVHFHGNGETLRTEMAFGAALHARGLGVFLVEYRGYGAAPGAPGEQAFYRDAEVAFAALAALGVGPEQIVLSGQSLGTGVAVEMATRGRGKSLVLVSPYTSIPAVAARFAPIFPTSLVIRDRFDTLAKAPRVHIPTLVIHGDRDEVIPYDMGQAVAGAIAGAKLVTVEGAHHNDLFVRRRDLIDLIAAHGLAPP